jgi:hypothetical protein
MGGEKVGATLSNAERLRSTIGEVFGGQFTGVELEDLGVDPNIGVGTIAHLTDEKLADIGINYMTIGRFEYQEAAGIPTEFSIVVGEGCVADGNYLAYDLYDGGKTTRIEYADDKKRNNITITSEHNAELDTLEWLIGQGMGERLQ